MLGWGGRRVVLLSLLTCTACVANEIGGGAQLATENVPNSDVDAGPGQDAVPGQDALPGQDVPRGPADTGIPSDAGLIYAPFKGASVGGICRGTGTAYVLVLDENGGDCDQHAPYALDTPAVEGIAVFEIPGDPAVTGSFSATGRVCVTGLACEDLAGDFTISNFVAGAGATIDYAIPFADRRAEGSTSAVVCDYGAILGLGGPSPAENLRLSDVSLYQSVKVPVVEDDQAVPDQNAPIVAGRGALARIFVETLPGWATHEVTGRIELELPNGTVETLEVTKTISADSTETDGQSTFNLGIPPEYLEPGTRFRVGVYEASSCDPTGAASEAQFPDQDFADLGVFDVNGSFQVVLVPVRYNADGSGRLPDTNTAQLERYRDTIFSMFPVATLDLTVRAPIDWEDPLARNGAGWSELLNAILALRNDDGPADNVYYYGIFSPEASFNNYCNGGCVLGLGPLPGPNDVYPRGAIGIGFTGDRAPDTAAHELGHTLGREHAPCQVQNGDNNYPYQGGVIGVWGYDSVNQTLLSPTQTADFMSYCDPTWISDYTYTAIYNRIAYVNQNAFFFGGQPAGRYRTLVKTSAGFKWGDEVELKSPTQGDVVQATVHRLGASSSFADILRMRLSHLDDEIYLVPIQDPFTLWIDIPGAGLVEY